MSIDIATDTVSFFAARAQRGSTSPQPRVAGPLQYTHPARTAQEMLETPANNVAGSPRLPANRSGMSRTQQIRAHQASMPKPAQPSPNVPAPAPRARRGTPWS